MHRDAAGCTGVAIQAQYRYNTSTGIAIQCDASRCSRVYWGCNTSTIQVQYKYWDCNTMRCIEMQPGVLGLQYKHNTGTIQVLGLQYNAMHRDAAGCTGVAIQAQYRYNTSTGIAIQCDAS